MLKALPSFVTALTAIVGVCFAKRGLDKWHAETIGKRKAELAEQALMAFYEARDVFVWVRSPGMFGGEGSTRQSISGETERQRSERNTYFIPLERLTREADLFARLQALRYSFAAYFGPKAVPPFQAIRNAQAEISSTVGVLMQMIDEEGSTGQFRQDNVEPLKATLWGAPQRPDKFDESIAEAVRQIENLCKPVLEKVGP